MLFRMSAMYHMIPKQTVNCKHTPNNTSKIEYDLWWMTMMHKLRLPQPFWRITLHEETYRTQCTQHSKTDN